jgi:lipoprotein-anchoring transpeptidase ErfK/SrfK
MGRVAGVVGFVVAAVLAGRADVLEALPAPPAATISAETINRLPTAAELDADDGPGVLHAQILLDRAHFSPGVLNGKTSESTASAVQFFQQAHGLPATGRLDPATYDALVGDVGGIDGAVRYTLTAEDLAGPYFWIPISVYEQAKLSCECYASALEMLDERFHTVTDVLRKLNPGVSFGHLQVGMQLWVPNVEPFDASHAPERSGDEAVTRIEIDKSGRYLHAYAADGSLVYHFPATVGSDADPSPSGRYRVESVLYKPVFHYDPSLYSDVADSRPRATLPGGPNSPVGIVWIATSRDHVGIHGTPLPHTIGLASSHGCVRLTNWDAARLAAAVRPGVEIRFLR